MNTPVTTAPVKEPEAGVLPNQHLLTMADLARVVGRHPSTVLRWLRESDQLRACVVLWRGSSPRLSVSKLRAAGFLA
jgi:hypothetical protein